MQESEPRRPSATQSVAAVCSHAERGNKNVFLLCVYRTQTEVDGDTFGACLTAKGWWPEEHIPTLVDEYVLAMRLLEQYDGPIAFTP
jgi:hypothetical protein